MIALEARPITRLASVREDARVLDAFDLAFTLSLQHSLGVYLGENCTQASNRNVGPWRTPSARLQPWHH